MDQITFDDKQDYRVVDVPEIYKVTAANINEIKAVVNAMVTAFSSLRQRIQVNITSADFTGGYYTNTDTIGLTPDVDFRICTNGGSGVYLKVNDGYTFNSTLGRITMSPDDYSITIFKPLS